MARAERPSEGRTTNFPLLRRGERSSSACIAWAACAWRKRKAFPSLANSRTPVVTGAFGTRTGGSYYPRGSRRRITDRSRLSFGRHPAKDDAFQRTWVPFTVYDTAAVLPARRGLLLVLYGSASLSRRPHVSCFRTRVLFLGALQAPLRGQVLPWTKRIGECWRLFEFPELCRAWP